MVFTEPPAGGPCTISCWCKRLTGRTPAHADSRCTSRGTSRCISRTHTSNACSSRGFRRTGCGCTGVARGTARGVAAGITAALVATTLLPLRVVVWGQHCCTHSCQTKLFDECIVVLHHQHELSLHVLQPTPAWVNVQVSVVGEGMYADTAIDTGTVAGAGTGTDIGTGTGTGTGYMSTTAMTGAATQGAQNKP